MRLRDVARECEQHPHRVLRRGHHVRLGRVRDDDAALGGGVHVHVVHADARAADRAQPLGLRDQVRVELRGRADQHPVELADPALELAVLPVDPELDVEAGVAQQLDAAVADLLLDQDRAASRRHGHAGLQEHPLRGGDARAELDVGAELLERHLERRRRS